MEKLGKYIKEGEMSYTFGAFPTFELIKNKPKQVVKVVLHSKLKQTADTDKLKELCFKNNISIEIDDKFINKVVDKENCFVVGVFKKFIGKKSSGSHLVLVNPSDMGNIGTIMRTALGFDMKNLIIVRPCVDIFNPKVVRASMGAIFSLNIVEMDSVDEYLKSNNNEKFFFMLNGKNELGKFVCPTNSFDLVFGNEATGLDNRLLNMGKSVVIHHSKNIDSLNLPISVGMAIYEFNKSKF